MSTITEKGPQPPNPVVEEVQAQQEKSSKKSPRILTPNHDRTAHLEAFYRWLPTDLHAAPGIDWTKITSPTIRFLVNTVGASPDAAYLAMYTAMLLGQRNQRILTGARLGNRLFELFRSACGITDLTQLANYEVWEMFFSKTPLTYGRSKQVDLYSVVALSLYPQYLARLEGNQRRWAEQYAFPPPPPLLRSKHTGRKILSRRSEERRKGHSDVLVPLYSVLCALVKLRQQAAKRLLHTFQQAIRQVEESQLDLPFAFEYEERLPDVNRDAQNVADIRLEGRPVLLPFLIWDRPSWVRKHPERIGYRTKQEMERELRAYQPERNHYFLQFVGPATDLLWFGDLIEQRLLQRFLTRPTQTEDYKSRWDRARELGATAGFDTTRPGLLNPSIDIAFWMHRQKLSGELIFEPESLYRGILYGATLTLIALGNGSRVSELLQVSRTRFKTRPVWVKMLKDGQQITEQRTMYFQHLLPKGAFTEEERQLFPISTDAVKLLKEIYEGLIKAGGGMEATGGKIPVVQPAPEGHKAEDLKVEEYLFQWGASPDGKSGILRQPDVTVLMRFILHGLELTTAAGDPILISTHLLRHVTATAARHEYGVPPEVVAWVLHHHQRETSPQTVPQIPGSTAYYSQMPREQALEAMYQFHFALEEEMRALKIHVPAVYDLELMNENQRDAFERWHTLHPTAFGYCGCRYLCPRGYNRSLCIGCRYLVPDPDKIEYVLQWRNSYAQQAEELEASGNSRDARQARRLVQQLDDLINSMRIVKQAEADGSHVPFFRTLPAPEREVVHTDGQAS